MWNKDVGSAKEIENPGSSVKRMPSVFCLENLQCLPDDNGGFNYRATLCHDRVCIMVSFNCAEFDSTLERGQFVFVNWLPTMQSIHGAIQVEGLIALNSPAIPPVEFDLRRDVPHTSKSVDRHLMNCARSLWRISSKEMRSMMLANIVAQTVRLER
jgi:hypothetical protein